MIESFLNLSTANQIAVVAAIIAFLSLCVGLVALFKKSADKNTIQSGKNSKNVIVEGNNAKIEIK